MNLQFNTLPEGLLVTLIGIMIVFLGLTILIALISIINRLTGGIGQKKKKAAPAPAQFTPAPAPIAAPAEENAIDPDEFIAIIAAAIAMMGEEGKGLVVRRVRRSSNASAWNKAGREEQVYSRY